MIFPWGRGAEEEDSVGIPPSPPKLRFMLCCSVTDVTMLIPHPASTSTSLALSSQRRIPQNSYVGCCMTMLPNGCQMCIQYASLWLDCRPRIHRVRTNPSAISPSRTPPNLHSISPPPLTRPLVTSRGPSKHPILTGLEQRVVSHSILEVFKNLRGLEQRIVPDCVLQVFKNLLQGHMHTFCDLRLERRTQKRKSLQQPPVLKPPSNGAGILGRGSRAFWIEEEGEPGGEKERKLDG